jgi:hypothetical protein
VTTTTVVAWLALAVAVAIRIEQGLFLARAGERKYPGTSITTFKEGPLTGPEQRSKVGIHFAYGPGILMEQEPRSASEQRNECVVIPS